jgi:tetratricopeptide (TPR) repeat protein
VQSGKTTTLIAKEFLAQCATSITACYHLLKGDGFLPVEYALSQYLPYLIALAKSPSPVQKEAAYLAAQGCCLMSLIKLHRLQFHERVALCKQGVEFARFTGDSLLLAATLAELGIAWFESGHPKNMLQEYQEAERLLPKEPPFFPLRLQSRIYTGLSGAYARTGRPREAKNYLDLANAVSLSSDDDLFIPCLDYDLSFKILWESFIHADLGELLKDQNKVPSKEARFHLGKADTALEQVLPESTPERVLIEITLQRASVAVKLGDLENFEKYIKEGAQKAKILRSDKRQEEARDVWREAMQRWSHEDRVIQLWEWVL